jgi:hypothetical protein
MLQYFDCTQHDYKQYDFDGRIQRRGSEAMQPLITAEVASFYIPLRQRRPSAPIRIGKTIVEAFTNMLFGEDRWPRLLCSGDPDTQDYAEALAKEEGLRVAMVQARNLGGATGSVGISWAFDRGKPRVEVHNVRNLYVHEWEDRKKQIVAHVSEFTITHEDEYDALKKRIVRNYYWQRQDWTPDATVSFLPAPFKPGVEPMWIEDPQGKVQHGFGFCPFVWIQNQPSSDPEGVPDYHGQYDAMDSLDLLNSVISRGTILNLDPTVVLKMNAIVAGRTGIKKGSDNALTVGENGDAHYLEIAGSGVTAGLAAKADARASILEACQCVIPDPDQVAAAGTSSVAIKAIYAPMLGKAAVHRELYGAGIKLLIEQQLRVARERNGRPVTIQVPADPKSESESESSEAESNSVEAVESIDLPPKMVPVPKPPPDPPKIGPDGIPEPKSEEPEPDIPMFEEVERVPGKGERIDLGWGEWFPLTAQDKNQAVQAVQLASGGKAVLSQQTAVEEAATIFNRDPAEEWGKVQKSNQEDQVRQATMFPPAGGPVGKDDAPGEDDDEDDESEPEPKPGMPKRPPNPFAPKAPKPPGLK